MQTDAPKVPYVGSRISLISKSGIRYVGTLYTIDTKASTVALKDVRSFGTEGRHRDSGPVQPSDQVYSYIIFRGPDIMDLQFLTDPPSATTAATTASRDPTTNGNANTATTANATTTSTIPPVETSSPKSTSTSQPTAQSEVRRPAQRVQPSVRPPANASHTQPEVPVSGPDSVQHSRPQQVRGEVVQQNHVNGTRRVTPTPPTPRAWGPPPGRRQRRRGANVPDEDFDFESMNSQFEKAVTVDGQPVEKRYDKTKSFFDSLVPEKEVRGERNAAQRRATDMETFGEVAVRRGRRGRGRGRGRGRRRIGNDRLPAGRISNANA